MTQDEYTQLQQSGKVQAAQEDSHDTSAAETPAQHHDAYTLEDFLPMLVQMLQNGANATARSHKSSPQSFADTVQTTVIWEANDFAAGITWDAANNRFKATKAGTYLITVSIAFTSTAANGQYQTLLFKNSTQVNQSSALASASSGQLLSVTVSDTLKLSAGDTVHVEAWHSSGGAKSISGSTFLCWFSITQVA